MRSSKQRSANNAAVVADDQVVSTVLDELAGDRAAGQQREPSWAHPFPARLPISVAKYLVNGLTKDQAVILDPMMGSGTTLIAAKECGRRGIGFDRDLLAQRIAWAATASYKTRELETLGESILRRATEISGAKPSLTSLRDGMTDEDVDFLKYWFTIKAQRELFAFQRAIREVENDRLQNLAWVVFSSLIIAKSAGASRALDISRSRPHRVDEKPIALPMEMWTRRFNAAVQRSRFVDSELKAKVTASAGDARKLSLSDKSVDFILTSPPYRNAVDYLRSHKFSLVWMGASIPEVRDLRGTMIGSERGLFSLDGIPDALENRLTRVIAPRREQAMTRRYLSDLRKTIGEMQRVLKPGGLAVMVVGPTMINSKKTDAANVLDQIAQHVGLTPIGSSIRVINPQRRSLPAPNRVLKDSFLAARMRREVIVAFRK